MCYPGHWCEKRNWLSECSQRRKNFKTTTLFKKILVPSRPKMGFPGGSDRKESACNAGDSGSIHGLGRSQEKGMATHSSILAWRIPWTEEAGGLQFMRCKESDTTEQLTLCTKKLFSRLSDTSALFCIHTLRALLSFIKWNHFCQILF